jgi:hypothetical protein
LVFDLCVPARNATWETEEGTIPARTDEITRSGDEAARARFNNEAGKQTALACT